MFNKTLFILASFNLLSLTTNTISTTALSTPRLGNETEEIATVDNQWERQNTISPYDNQFRLISEREGNDWRLLCAMAYHESRFKTDIVSHCGARGILQVMPHVARQFDVSAEQLSNVEDNIYVANRVMTLIEDMLRFPASASQDDKLKLTLAAYNCGIGRVLDARRLARYYNEDSNSWDVVSQYLKKLNQEEFYTQEAVKNGRFKGAGQTLAYVDNVVSHYNSYCTLAMR